MIFNIKDIKIKELKSDDILLKEFEIIVQKEIISKKIDEKLIEIQSEVEIKGFRKGHAPIDVVKTKYLDNAFSRAINATINDISKNIIEENKLKLALAPNIEFLKEPSIEDKLQLKISYVLWAEIKNLDLQKIKIEFPIVELSKEEKNKEIEIFRNNVGKEKEVQDINYKIQNGDSTNIFFEGKKDGIPFDGGKAENYKLIIGSNTFIKGFEEQLIDHKVGDEFTINISFPENYHLESLAGQPVTFDIKIHQIFTRELPELNDEFAKEMQFDSMNKIQELLWNNLKNNAEGQFKSKVKNKVFEKIFENLKIKLPKKLIEDEIQRILEQMEKDFVQKQNTQQSKEEVVEYKEFNKKSEEIKIRTDVEKNFKMFFLIDKISNDENINVTSEEAKELIMQDAMQMQMNAKELIEKFEKDSNFSNNLIQSIKEQKVYNIILEKISKEEKKMTLEEFGLYMRDYKA